MPSSGRLTVRRSKPCGTTPASCRERSRKPVSLSKQCSLTISAPLPWRTLLRVKVPKSQRSLSAGIANELPGSGRLESSPSRSVPPPGR